MTVIKIKGKEFNNPVEFALSKIGGKWKMPILWRLKDKSWRYSELKKDIVGITHKMLTQQLRELEEDGFINRKVFAVVPPKVEYSLSKKGEKTVPLIISIRSWGLELYLEELSKTGKIPTSITL